MIEGSMKGRGFYGKLSVAVQRSMMQGTLTTRIGLNHTHTYIRTTHTHTHTYIYIYVYVCL